MTHSGEHNTDHTLTAPARKGAPQDGTIASRRELLRLGAVGLPMLVTLRASASEALISQLRCTLTVPARYIILVHRDGRAWVAENSSGSEPKLSRGTIKQIKRDALFTFEAGTVGAPYTPDVACEAQDNSGNGNGGSQGDPVDEDERGRGRGGNGGRGGEPVEDGSATQTTDDNDPCDHRLVYFGSQTTFTIGDRVSESGAITVNDELGLFTRLAFQSAIDEGAGSNFPGVSCVASVLDFVNQGA